MVSAQQVPAQQTELVSYQQTSSSVTTQGFLDVISIIPTMMILFFFVLMMGLMRDITREPGNAKEIVVKAVEVGKEVVGVVRGVKKE